MTSSGSKVQTLVWILAGVLVGALVGYLFRPSVPLVGQLPLRTVLTRGSELSGMDVVLRSAAERAFNFVAGGAVAGGAVLGVIARLARR